MKVSKWTLSQMTKEALEDALKRCKPGSEMYRAIKAELETRKGNRPPSIEDWL